ncbi:response regulator transcription factor [Hydrogenophaga sp. OTU3427]|uniref:response regulator transcription factor n=1 Tax=Hydrogenophaga sp. OTU3427 TaxID=3043856 RepID=UPI00313BE861
MDCSTRSMPGLRVLVVDDHALFREGMRLLLRSMEMGLQVDLAATCIAGVEMAHAAGYDLILLDWHLNGLEGLDAVEALRTAAPMARLVVLSGEKSAAVVQSAIDHGAAGFIPKDSSPDALLHALQTVVWGGIYLPPSALALLGESLDAPLAPGDQALSAAFPDLTERQLDVLGAALRGLSNKLIAKELGITDGTVKTHLNAIFRLLDVKNRTEAVYEVARRGVRIS